MEPTMMLTPTKAVLGGTTTPLPPLHHAPTMAEQVARMWILRGADGCGFDGIIGREAANSPAVSVNRSASH
ncbi:hypothetical protein [Variovorax sp. OV700]|uniref:hypothetical protein n=1 Tax=Variovorax sp. OV700 TaxID=1882826 RepID=UPI000888E8BB|nr:hypothetical protein [Variovorax sp. OV700]SDH71129.1 hypothetical protein SAMN05444748_102179 [Variovorax sp. OV700]